MKTERFLKTICTAFLLVVVLSSKTLWATRITNFSINATIQDGDVYNRVDVGLNAVVDITGGTINGSLNGYSSSQINITGGLISGSLTGNDSSQINIWGGNLSSDMGLRDDSQITIYGSDFLLDGQSVSGTLDLDYLASTGALTKFVSDTIDWRGNLTGVLLDGTPMNVNVWILYFPGSSDSANITLLPEPATSLLLLTGIVLARNRKTKLNPFQPRC